MLVYASLVLFWMVNHQHHKHHTCSRIDHLQRIVIPSVMHTNHLSKTLVRTNPLNVSLCADTTLPYVRYFIIDPPPPPPPGLSDSTLNLPFSCFLSFNPYQTSKRGGGGGGGLWVSYPNPAVQKNVWLN